ncbi:glycosyltransferase [Streptomyces sp. GC420]|nr:glycosyltransferase [Streptomyces sp. GC420]
MLIAYNDVPHVAAAVRSALAQGPAVREVVAVDDGSDDGTGELLERLAAAEPRLSVVRRAGNSGGCGTPRNDGLAALTSPYAMFLDSDDVLPPGAVAALLAAAQELDAEVAAGLCVRRELPSGREVPWQPALYAERTLVPRPSRRPRLVSDTLCVNKLYRTGFLREHGIRFPDGRFPYEDFVFGARVLAAAPRIALIPDPVYVWHVRRDAERLSISLDREGIGNWRDRVEAHRQVVDILLGAGEKRLASAARAKFLDHELRMYARDLASRPPAYRREWWERARAHVAGFDPVDFERAPLPGRILGRLLLLSPDPRDLDRVRELAARPARLLPPYARGPAWSEDLPRLSLDDLLTAPLDRLPFAVDARLERRRLRLRVYDLYGRLAAAGPLWVDAEFRERDSGRRALVRTAVLRPEAGTGAGTDGTTGAGTDGAAGTDADGGSWAWTSELRVDLDRLARAAPVWDLRVRVHCASGSTALLSARATGTGRAVLPGRGSGGVLLAQPYATHAGALALRLAPGVRGACAVLLRRVRRGLARR